MKTELSFSVHDIVDAILRQGSIDMRVFNSETMQEGTRMHAMIQSSHANPYYNSEYFLAETYESEDFIINISGRADGLIKEPTGKVTVDEIKTTVSDLEKFKEENFAWHQGQAKMYAWMYLKNENQLDKTITVRVSYYRQHHSKENLIIDEDFTFEQLDKFVTELIEEFIERLREVAKHNADRNNSLKYLEFPYSSFRSGQQDLMAFCDRILIQKGKGYALAPTGIGKTVCVLYPFVKQLAKDPSIRKIYYLTSKNSIKRQALKTVEEFIKKDADLRCVAITAKETICMNEPGLNKHCNPDECPFAVGYYSKIYGVLRKALSEKRIFDAEDIKDLASIYNVCPFQLSLDLAVYCDICIYDYNYVFDPVVGNPEIRDTSLPLDDLLLVDETHNLPSRARGMYSATISVDRILDAYLDLGKKGRKVAKVVSSILSILDWFDRKSYDKDIEVLHEIPLDFITLLKGFQDECLSFEKKEHKVLPDSYLSLKANIRGFLLLPYNGRKNYCYDITYKDNKAIGVNIRCLDASEYIKSITDRFTSTIFFSATLSPTDYYISLLGGDAKEDVPSKLLVLPSPFERKNRLVMLNSSPSLKYEDRDKSFADVLNSIYQMVKSNVGNYFLFFPSYSYMMKAYEKFEEIGEFVCHKQEHNMSPKERNEFLDGFEEDPLRTHLGFLVLGGVFSEGIELKKHALKGVAIVSVGIPGVGYDNETLKNYYSDIVMDGFSYAYTYPGFNKVVQACGRLIRNDDDKGVILLIDKRFSFSTYRKLLDEVYPDRIEVKSPQEIGELTTRFWKENS